MNFTKTDIDKLKQHFLAKLGGVMQGHIKVDKNETYDLGTSEKRWRTIYAKEIIADSVDGGGGSGGNAETVDGFHASANAMPNELLPLSSLGVFPKETYHLAILTDGSRSLMGNLDVGGGFRVDNVDLDAHVHNGQPGMGMQIDHRDLLANDSDVHPQYAMKATDEIITGNWMFTDIEDRSVGWKFEPATKAIVALPFNLRMIAGASATEIQVGPNSEILTHVDGSDIFQRVGLDADSITLSGSDPDFRLWSGAVNPLSANFTLAKDGSIRASKGTIGGWGIYSDRLEGTYTKLLSGGELWMGTGSASGSVRDYVVLSAVDPSKWRLWAGHDNPQYAPFKVNRWGQVHMGDAFVTGTMRSTNYVSGEAGWQIGADGKAIFHDILASGRIETVVFSERKMSVMSGTFYISDAAALKAAMSDTDDFIIVDNDVFSQSDILYIKSVTSVAVPGGFETTSVDEYMKVVSASEQLAEDQWKFMVVRDLAGTGKYAYKIGDSFVRKGNSTTARPMEPLASGDEAGAYGAYQPGGSGSSIEGGWLVLEGTRGVGPYFAVARRRGPLYNQFDEVVRIGNLQGIAVLEEGRPDNNPFYGAFVGDAAAYWAYDPEVGLRIKTRSGSTAIDENGILTDQFTMALGDSLPAYVEDHCAFYFNKPVGELPRLSLVMEIGGVQETIDRVGDMSLAQFDLDADGILDHARNADVAPWGGITGKPATYAPSAHTHLIAQITDYTPFDPDEIIGQMWLFS